MFGIMLKKNPEKASAKEVQDFVKGYAEGLLNFRANLVKARDTMHPLYGLLYFFSTVAPYFDERKEVQIEVLKLQTKDTGIYPKLQYPILHTVKELELHIYNAGRSPHGWNRTTKGELVTLDDVYLGDINGIWTKPLSHWLKYETAHNEQDLETYAMIKKQAKGFMHSHIPKMIELIDQIIEYETK